MSIPVLINDLERIGQGSNSTTRNMESISNEPTEDAGGAEDMRNESLANIEILVLSVILFLAILGNGLMLIALRRQLTFRPMSRMYFFMLNLSITDLLVAFGNILPQLAWDITFRFKGPDFLCRLVKFLQIFVLYLSTYVLTSMALDRYMVVCHHSFSRNHYGGLRAPKIMVTISWILAIIFASPQALIFSLSEIRPGVIDCWTFLSPSGIKVYVTWFVLSIFIFPLLLVGISYGAICVKVVSFSLPGKRSNEGKSTGSSKFPARRANGYGRYTRRTSFSSSSMRTESEAGVDEGAVRKDVGTNGALKKQLSQAKVKTLKLTLVIIISFFICWSPFCITQLVTAYNPDMSIGSVNVILLLLSSLNSCTNPWIYLAFSESLCQQLRIFLGLGLKRGSNEESIGDEQDLGPPPLVKKKVDKAKGGDLMEHPVKSQLNKRRHSFDEDGNGDDLQIHPETKSEVV